MKVNGSVKILDEDSEAFDTGRTYTITFDVFGDQLQGYIVGISFIKCTDQDLSMGKIGLYCWGNIGAVFSDIIVKAIPPKTDLLFSDNFESGLNNWNMKDDAPQLHAEAKGNKNWLKYDFEYGDVASAKANSDIIVKHRFKLPRINHWDMTEYKEP